ncbi:MAG: UDP-N-acetylmuramoyl-tripeptide--D-alanyl-D-alanine ligase [Chloroflexi bacterium]|nr:UDP-N-acetylmuramoyl-tripeptide--D-alanyl-D-alanine ligase [Chloroflexota bacterium]
MAELLLALLAGIWLLGVWMRIYQQARFYQIEEYMSGRYLRWVLARRGRLLPARSIAAWILGLAIGGLLAQAPASAVPQIIALIAAVVAVYPARELEMKKKIAMTARMKRLLVSAGALSAIVFAALHNAVSAFAPMDMNLLSSVATSSLGLALFILTPVWLATGNLLAQPLESLLRRRYLRRAAVTLEKLQPKVIGITGSYGKTTTKNFLRDILSARFRAYATPKSYNTLMGISLAINRDLADDYRSEYFISEMGAYVEGEIDRICQLTPPDIAIVTEIGPQHLERFGTLDKVKEAKYEIVRNLPPDGVAVLNWDNPYVREMAAAGYPNTILTVSRELNVEAARAQGVAWIASDIRETLAGLTFRVAHLASGEEAQIGTRILGEHNVTNLLLCIAVAHCEGVPLRDIALRIGSLQPAESRLAQEKTAAGITIINDAYSANPKGVVSALKVLGLHEHGARLLVTPGMIELGNLQDEENHKLGLLAAQHATDIILIGKEQTQPIARAIRSTSFDLSRLRVVETLTESIDWYQQNLKAGDTVLFLNDLPDTY